MAILSKFTDISLPYNCYEAGHTWHPDCNIAALSLGAIMFNESVKIYFPLYVISLILKRKFSLDACSAVLTNTFISSAFLGFHGFGIILFGCILRKLLGRIYFLTYFFIPTFITSFLAMFIERKNRRLPLAIYVTYVATETVLRMAAARGIVKPVPNAEVYLFSVVMAINLYVAKKYGYSDDIVSSIFKFIFGNKEAKQNAKSLQKKDAAKHKENFLLQKAVLCGMQLEEKIGTSLLEKIPMMVKHSSCHHDYNCIFYCLQGFCHLPVYAIPAALLGGFFMKFFPSSTISLYLMWKTIEKGYLEGMEKGTLPHIKCFTPLLYSFSTAILLHTAVMEAHNLKPSYLRFLRSLTQKRIVEVNHLILDFFGTQSSKMFPKVWPETDYRYTTRKIVGSFYYVISSYFPAFAASVLCYFVERESRRRALTVYLANAVYLFCATMAAFFYFIKKSGFSEDAVSSIFKFLFGKDEAQRKDEKDHASCHHASGCMIYCLQGFLRPFLLGYVALSVIRCLSLSKKLLHSPSLLVSLLTDRRSFNLGLFLGGFGGIFKVVNCLLRWYVGKDQPIHAIPAALLGGLCMKFFPSSTISLYLFWKLLEFGYLSGIEAGILPHVMGFQPLLLSASTALLIHSSALEPHNLKPSYLRFLQQITNNKVSQVNVGILDIFGTHASKIRPNFWPKLDHRYTSEQYKDSALLWLIP
ncbi:Transmembrane protein 135 like protein [Argiope bruennichi]|uniref:Transmembrane protein 135 like protein n=1 Tax=Argiope bruennichi TaxID=94029 RepID=A0A8T0EQW3_ARGBR|nr:Transmembrane protein 135 like protein [Argiope bruennichi]